MTITEIPWWKDAVVYQIWPHSFKDSNGDGIGDFKGIISQLDHIKNLGATVIWLSPHYKSPCFDMGYDIADYEDVNENYGTLEECFELIDAIHAKGLKIIFDLVVNHTSHEHKWFKESRSSKTNPKRDWYIWKPPRYDENGKRHPPNNWSSHFSGSAWSYDELTDEYYLRLFANEQPDLNWENPDTRNAIYDSALKFWYEHGVDGFRIDTAGLYSKTQTFLDAPVIFPDQEFQPCGIYTHNGPRIHEFHKEMYEKTTGNYDAMTVGEVGHGSREDALKYVSAKEKELNMIFIFDPVEVGSDPSDRFRYNGFKLSDFKKAIKAQVGFISGTDAWSAVFIENHDQPRSVTRFGNTSTPLFHEKSAKLLALLQTSLTGTLFIYQGQEIGMTNVSRSWDISEYLDINTINYVEAFKEKIHTEEEYEKLLDVINLVARDHSRTPVQWDDSSNGGFTTGKPWTRVNDNYKDINAAKQVKDPNSIYSFWSKLLKFRNEHKEILTHGNFEILDFENEDTFQFVKTSENGEKAHVVLNFSDKTLEFENQVKGGKLAINNYDQFEESKLQPYEARLYII
ncbi:hypothetical protein WICMUC_005828 [Wickerhamomyces mucosus]|uniref:Glycosyl hydrolase family 13 catalytic domain-containing protein n=1 Tax=Wickerhamomyces mucosus TaxID=1378264 RepID=A0A9P8T322_9ASCO|nr:hypothetical protein WICMUC_005828 [Wickerhamomyces mucosus]